MAIKFDDSEDEGRTSGVNQPLQPTAPPPDVIPGQERLNFNSHEESPPSRSSQPGQKRRKWTVKRALCCLGWVFCFPVYCTCWMLREAPVDDDDLREDDCYPCWS